MADGVPSGAPNMLEQRVQKLLALRTDTPAMLETLSAVGGGAAPATAPGARDALPDVDALRTQVRSVIDARSVELVDAFLARMAPLESLILSLDASARTLDAAVGRARDRIERSEALTASFLTQMERLQGERSRVQARLDDVTAFLRQYELTDEEVAALERGPGAPALPAAGGTADGGAPTPAGAADGSGPFFAALAHLTSIRAAALDLLSGPRQALGLELYESASKQHAAALDACFEWALERCGRHGQLVRAAAPAPGDAPPAAADGAASCGTSGGHPLRRCLQTLAAHRPRYYRSCQDAAVTAVRRSLATGFLTALTGARPGASSRAGGGRYQDADADGSDSAGGLEDDDDDEDAMASARRGGDASGGGSGRPLDASAHDPLRYIGDMCAWVHYRAAEEGDAIGTLFPLASASGNGAASGGGGIGGAAAGATGAAEPPSSTADAAAVVSTDAALADSDQLPLTPQAMLASAVDALAKPLAGRIEASLRHVLAAAGASAVGPPAGIGSGAGVSLTACASAMPVVYRAMDLLHYYEETLGKMMTVAPPLQAAAPAAASALVAALRTARAVSAPRVFTALLDAYAGGISASPLASLPSDLSAHPLVVATCGVIVELCKTHAAALATSPAPPSAAVAAAGATTGAAALLPPPTPAAVANSLLPPLLSACRASAEGLRLADTAVYMLNNLSAMQTALTPHSAALQAAAPAASAAASATALPTNWVSRLTSEAGHWEETLVQQTANDLLSGCRLLSTLSALRAVEGAAALTAPGTRPDDLRHILASFFDLLASHQLLQLFDRVTARAQRSRLRRDVLSVVAAAYARLHAEVSDPRRGYAAAVGGDASVLLRQTPAQVEVLLGLK